MVLEPRRRAELDLAAELLERADERVERAAYRCAVRIDVDRDRRDIGAREDHGERRIGDVRREVGLAPESLRRCRARGECGLDGAQHRDLVARDGVRSTRARTAARPSRMPAPRLRGG